MDENQRFDDAELGRRLRAYASARLSPNHWASVRMRTAVIEHGRASRSRAGLGGRLAWRSALFVALVALLAVSTGATAALAASAGGPLYGTRLWIESALVSLSADRAGAQAALVDQRLDDATAAADHGNGAGVSAALAAYRSEIDSLLATAGDDASNLARVQAELGRHIAVLQALAVANPQAADAIQSAIEASQKALDKALAKIQANQPGHGKPSSPPGKP